MDECGVIRKTCSNSENTLSCVSCVFTTTVQSAIRPQMVWGWAVLLVLLDATNQGLSPCLDGYFLSKEIRVYLFFIIFAICPTSRPSRFGSRVQLELRALLHRSSSCAFFHHSTALITFRLMKRPLQGGHSRVVHVWEHLALIKSHHIFVHSHRVRYYLISPLLLCICLRLLKPQGDIRSILHCHLLDLHQSL